MIIINHPICIFLLIKMEKKGIWDLIFHNYTAKLLSLLKWNKIWTLKRDDKKALICTVLKYYENTNYVTCRVILFFRLQIDFRAELTIKQDNAFPFSYMHYQIVLKIQTSSKLKKQSECHSVVSVLVKCNSKFFDCIACFLIFFFQNLTLVHGLAVKWNHLEHATMLKMADQTRSTAQLAVRSALAPWWQTGTQRCAGKVKLFRPKKHQHVTYIIERCPHDGPFHTAVRKNYNWGNIYVNDPDQTYDVFLSTFLEFYNKHYPIGTF